MAREMEKREEGGEDEELEPINSVMQHEMIHSVAGSFGIHGALEISAIAFLLENADVIGDLFMSTPRAPLQMNSLNPADRINPGRCYKLTGIVDRTKKLAIGAAKTVAKPSGPSRSFGRR